MGSNGHHITASRRPVADHVVSSSWEVMERPVRIGTTHSSNSGNQSHLNEEQNRAQYVTTQENSGDIMATIASEFEMHAQRTSSERNSNSQLSRNCDVGNNVTSGRSNSIQANSTENMHQSHTTHSRSGLQEQVASHRSHANPSRPDGGSSLSENITTQGRVAHYRSDSQHSCPTDDRNNPNPVRHNRTSQLRNTLVPHNREHHTTSGPGSNGAVDRNPSSVAGGSDGRARRTRRVEPGLAGETASMSIYTDFQHDTYPEPPEAPPPVARYDDGQNQQTLLDLMTRGFRTFTVEMAEVIIDKLKPENEAFARLVGREVKEATDKEIKQLRDALEKAEARVKEVEAENSRLQEFFSKERDTTKKEMEKEILKRAKLYQDQSAIITKLEGDVQRFQTSQKEKEKMWRKAEVKAKAEETKRLKIEEEFADKIKDMQKQLDRVKGDLLVEKSVRRVKTMSSTNSNSRVSSGRLISHHGGYKKHMVHPKHVPYDEGDN